MAPPKGCWTCKDRKISCDRTLPKCRKCLASKRECGGYGVRLTWPQGGNRNLLSKTITYQSNALLPPRGFEFVNVVPTDLRLHLATSGAWVGANLLSKSKLTLPTIPTASDLAIVPPSILPTSNDELLLYFESVIVDTLPVLHTDRKKISGFLMKSARTGRKPSSKAVRFSILALASCHRGDSDLQIDEFRQIALRQLSTHEDMTACEAGEHVAANILLCILAMQQIADGGSVWIGHVCSVKAVLDVFDRLEPCKGDYASTILGWAYYFDVMARFSWRHWRTEHIRAYAAELGFTDHGHQDCALQYLLVRKSFAKGMPSIAGHAHPVLQLLAEVSGTLMYSSDPRYHSDDYQGYLKGLRLKLENVSSIISVNDSYSEDAAYHTELHLELTRLAGLIYLERVSRNFSGQSSQINTWTRQAISIIEALESCTSSFTLLIVGCEASTDQERMSILQLYARTEKKPFLQHLLYIKGLIQTAWNYKDLQEDGDVEYIRMLNLITSTRDSVPSLV